MTKELFVKSIKAIKDQKIKEEKLCKDLNVLIDGHFVCHFNEPILISLIEVLADSMGDKDEWIEWWLWDTNFGKDHNEVKVKGRSYCIKTAGDLYKFLKMHYEVSADK